MALECHKDHYYNFQHNQSIFENLTFDHFVTP